MGERVRGNLCVWVVCDGKQLVGLGDRVACSSLPASPPSLHDGREKRIAPPTRDNQARDRYVWGVGLRSLRGGGRLVALRRAQVTENVIPGALRVG
eukprot:3206876-Prorocentrum_lima.AAC.1